MIDRITQRNEHGVIGTPHPMFLQDAIDKLADLEDLEEQGRLVVLPEGFDFEKLCEAVGAEDSCPEHFGLERKGTCGNMLCKECWEKALKGE